MNGKVLTFIGAFIGHSKNIYMPFYYYIFLFITLSIIFLAIRSFVLLKRHISVELFVKGLRNENNGNFEDAVVAYKSALTEVKKVRFHGNLKIKIVEKLKLMHTLIEYNNGVRSIRTP